jgi:hypothetical protein
MSKKAPTLPLISSTFALLDVMKGRAPLEKIVGAGYQIPVTITGYIQPWPRRCRARRRCEP